MDRRFLERHFTYLYHHITPNVHVWGRPATIVVEPSCAFTVERGRARDCRLIDELTDPSFELESIRSLVRTDVARAEGSDLDQVLWPLGPDVYEIVDNPFVYPGRRLMRFVEEHVSPSPGAPPLDGLCHFHPTDNPAPSPVDAKTVDRLAIRHFQKGAVRFFSLILAMPLSAAYILESGGDLVAFLAAMRADAGSLRADCRLYWPGDGATVSVRPESVQLDLG